MPPMRAFETITIRNLLSFGPSTATLELLPLNILIGPNSSGKSNLIEAIGLLQNAPADLGKAISLGSPLEEWFWKGKGLPVGASIEVGITRVESPAKPRPKGLTYLLEFGKGSGHGLEVLREYLGDEGDVPSLAQLRGGYPPSPFSLSVSVGNGEAMIRRHGQAEAHPVPDLDPRKPILSQLKDPQNLPEITYAGDLFSGIRLYRDWQFGSLADLRQPSDAGLPNDFLEEDAANLGVILDRLLSIPPVKKKILESLRTLHQDITDLRTSVVGARIQVRLEERGLTRGSIPLTRASDGVLRWLALLSILLNPSPVPLVCLEEPEIGLHPDIIPELARLLKDASTRMQLIVTTHSDRLVEAFTESPEDVVICETHDGGTTLRRLNRADLAAWLEHYSLGELWSQGKIGGNRW